MPAHGIDAETRTHLTSRLKDNPGDVGARMFLFQLLCVEEEWNKARTQLRTLARISPDAQVLAVAYRQAISGEGARAACFAGQLEGTPLVDPNGWASDLLAAIAADARGDIATGAQLRTDAFDRCPDTPGAVDGRAFEALYDGDMRFGPALEAIVAGRWGLIPFSQIEQIATSGPVDLRDLVWLPAEVRLRDGPVLAVLLPVRYPGVSSEADSDLRLARRTEWHETPHLVRGAGQRIWTTDAGEEVGILSFRRITFARP